ncbi:MAG: bacillithiol biosynthesis BshC, partial [Bacteroidetes bacterium]
MHAISHIPLAQTHAFSKLVIDYLQAESSLQPFYSFPVSQDGLWQSLQARQQKPINRELLFTALESQYKNVPANPATEHSLQLLLKDHCFTITTAHQPNIATGLLYFFYKIAHCIALAKACKQWFPAYEFVPVYYMGSEDADLAELGVFTVQGKKYTWQTNQKGAVGRMTVDAALLDILEQLYGQLGVLPFGVQVQAALRQCFTIGTTIQQATFALVHTIFGAEGLVTLVPDNATLKSVFLPIAEKEIQEGFSQKLVEQTTALLAQNYKQQASGREINLFYLQGDAR